MEINAQLKGLLSYLTKLTHTVDQYRVKFINVGINKVTKNGESVDQIVYDLDITPKDNDIPWLWDFFNCKSKHIVQEGCEMVSIDWSVINMKVNDIYYNGEKIKKYGGYIPSWFKTEMVKKIKQSVPNQIKTNFFCVELSKSVTKSLTLNVVYEVVDIYPDDGFVMDVHIYANQVLVDNELIENITPDIAEIISGHVQELGGPTGNLDDIFWTEITNYMDLSDCELWSHTYTYIVSVGGIETDGSDYLAYSTFSSKMCDFMNGDY